MIRSTLAGVRAHPGRLVATMLAVMLGVSFVCGTMIFGDTVKLSFFDQFARAARNVDAVVLPGGTGGAPSNAAPASDSSAGLPVDALDAVRRVAGVATAEARYTAHLPLLDRDGRLVRNGEQVGYAISAGADPLLRAYDVTTGRAPTAADEVAVDAKTAERARLSLGGSVTVLDTAQRRHRLTLVGTFTLAASSVYSGNSVVALTNPRLATLAKPSGYAEIVVRAESGVPPKALVDRITATLASSSVGTPAQRKAITVRTGEQRRVELAEEAVQEVDLVLFALSIFGVVALVVAAFVIFNTFTILVAQRIRELALLRCVGAGRRQVFGSVLLEAGVVGLVGGALGVAAGMVIAYGMFQGFGMIGAALPYHSPVLRLAPLLVAIVTGIGVTLLSAAVPALRATRIPPLAALRIDPNAGIRSVRGRTVRLVLAILAALAGGAITAAGAISPGRTANGAADTTSEILVIGGGMVVFLGLLISAPLFIGPLTTLLGALPARLFGTTVRLATANGRRNPTRAAVTAATLMVGVGLMTVLSVLLESSTMTFSAKLAAEMPVDYGLESADAGPRSGVPAEVVSALRARTEFDRVIAVRSTDGKLDGRQSTVGSIDRAGLELMLPDAPGTVAALRPGTALLAEKAAARAGKRAGDPITVTVAGRSATYTIAAVIDDSPMAASVLLDADECVKRYRGTGVDLPRTVLLRAAPGVRSADSRSVVETATADFPLLRIRSNADYREELTDQVNGLLGFFAGLLAVTFLIALVGIANTLSLSIVERTRELAVQRALGLTRSQVRATLLVEALLLACAGALVGVTFGVVYGVLLARVSLASMEAVLAVPVGQVLGYVALATIAGVLAAVLPAVRAQRCSIVAAMAHD